MKTILKIATACILCITLVACTFNQVVADINVIVQVAAEIGAATGNVSPADQALIQKLSADASAGIAVIQAVYNTYEQNKTTSNLQNVLDALQAVKSNLQAELAAAHISDPKTAQIVTNWVNLIVSTVSAIVAALPQLNPKVTGKSSFGKLPTPKSIQARWVSEVCKGDKVCGNLVHVK